MNEHPKVQLRIYTEKSLEAHYRKLLYERAGREVMSSMIYVPE
ncbi:MAG: hypothetical protein M0Z77_03045 [Thermoplasmatales archaeon]|nr:hypothetical protein [Thermoplasmatales archaeon]